MGVKKKSDINWTEGLIIDKLTGYLLGNSTVRYFLNNLYVFSNSWESDYLSLTKSGYLYEGEVKISKSDFKADFKKEKKHLLLETKYNGKSLTDNDLCPHYFFYAVPEGLIDVSEVPEYAGLVYATTYYPYVKWVKKPPLLHKEKYDDTTLNLQEKFYYNMINWKRKALKEFPNQISQMKKLLKESKTDTNGNEYPYTISEYKKMVEIKESENEFLKKQITELIDNCEDYKRELREIKKKEREV
jgi:hypothetical protein